MRRHPALTFLTLQSILITLMVSWIRPGVAADIIPSTANHTAVLGAGYQTDKQLFVGRCLAGQLELTGTPTSSFSFAQSFSDKQASDALGFSAGGRARFGIVEATLAAGFTRNATSSEFSTSSVWAADYFLPTEKLELPQKTLVGDSVAGSPSKWLETCGDDYVIEIVKGARLFFSIRIDFTSTEQKNEFESKFSIAGPLAAVDVSLKQATKQFSREAKVTVSALQIGGDVSKITDLFPHDEGKRNLFVQCNLGDFEKCASVISSALSYETDTLHGFPSQIAPGAKPGGAQLIYRTESYKRAGIYLQQDSHMTDAVEQARIRLHQIFEDQYALEILADRLLSYGLGALGHTEVLQQRDLIGKNISLILAVSRLCYDEPEGCHAAVTALNLASVDRSALRIPSPLTASYRLMIDKRVLSRKDSVNSMILAPEVVIPLRQFLRDQVLQPDQHWVSAVLFIQGEGIKEATVFFEDKEIKKIPLTGETLARLGKAEGDYAIIVLETTRPGDGWLDIDPSVVHTSLWESIPVANGTLYLIVQDAFGRQSRVDIATLDWDRTIVDVDEISCRYGSPLSLKMGSKMKVAIELSRYRTSWWTRNTDGLLANGTPVFEEHSRQCKTAG